jgi:hypothetical protein
VSELRREKAEKKEGFQALSKSERVAFLANHFGFLQTVLNSLQERQVLGRHGHPLTHSTVSRTWYCGLVGGFAAPNPEIVQELERVYQLSRRRRNASKAA